MRKVVGCGVALVLVAIGVSAAYAIRLSESSHGNDRAVVAIRAPADSRTTSAPDQRGERASLTTGHFNVTYIPDGYTLLSALDSTQVTGDEVYRRTYHAEHGTTPIVIESRRNLHTATISDSTLTGTRKVDADQLLVTLNGVSAETPQVAIGQTKAFLLTDPISSGEHLVWKEGPDLIMSINGRGLDVSTLARIANGLAAE